MGTTFSTKVRPSKKKMLKMPEERHYEEDEPQINIDEEDLIENNESDDGNAFHVFDEFILN